MKFLLISLLAFVPTISYAQSTEDPSKKYFYTRQECEPVPMVLSRLKYNWGEEPLWSGMGLTFGNTGQPFTGSSMFFVNQDTGSWTLATLYADGHACITAVGTAFEPYGG